MMLYQRTEGICVSVLTLSQQYLCAAAAGAAADCTRANKPHIYNKEYASLCMLGTISMARKHCFPLVPYVVQHQRSAPCLTKLLLSRPITVDTKTEDLRIKIYIAQMIL